MYTIAIIYCVSLTHFALLPSEGGQTPREVLKLGHKGKDPCAGRLVPAHALPPAQPAGQGSFLWLPLCQGS